MDTNGQQAILTISTDSWIIMIPLTSQDIDGCRNGWVWMDVPWFWKESYGYVPNCSKNEYIIISSQPNNTTEFVTYYNRTTSYDHLSLPITGDIFHSSHVNSGFTIPSSLAGTSLGVQHVAARGHRWPSPGAYKRRDDEGLGARKSPGKSCKPKGIQYNHYTHTHINHHTNIHVYLYTIAYVHVNMWYYIYTSYSNNQSRNSFNRWSLGSNRTLPVASWPAACRTSWTSKTFAAHLGMEKCDPSH